MKSLRVNFLATLEALGRDSSVACSEAVEELINFCFNILKLHRIDSYVMPRNAKSLRIMEKFGFEKEGLCKKCLEVNNKWEDHYIFGLINDKISPVARYDY